MRSLLFSLALSLTLLAALPAAAQTGFNPEYLGNAAGVGREGFCLKSFLSYFYQRGIAAHDVEIALEPQLFIPGFTGDIARDQIQFVVHMPIGYRRQKDASGQVGSVTGIGTLAAGVEHFWHLIDEEKLELWLDHGVTAGFPTATQNRNVLVGSGIRIGSNAFSAGAFQELFLRYRGLRASIMPVFVDWSFEDERTDQRNGLFLGILNSSIGYQFTPHIAAGVSFGFNLANVAGSNDSAGASLPLAVRAYAGPALSVSFTDNTALQASGIIDCYVKEASRGQGIFMALWHHF